jgi:hypothetical protein
MPLRLNSTLGMMGVVACAAVVVATYSAFASERGNPLLGLVIVAVCTAGVAGLRTSEGIARLKADGHPLTVRRLVTTITTDGWHRWRAWSCCWERTFCGSEPGIAHNALTSMKCGWQSTEVSPIYQYRARQLASAPALRW